MPKIVDHEKRKIQIAEATWNVIVREGLEQATVRKIAKEADLSVGSLRHYFSSQSELLAFSMKLVSERVKKRALNKNYESPPMDVALEMLSEFLPIDEDQRIAMEVWLVFSSRMLVDKKLDKLGKDVYAEMRQAMEYVIGGLIQMGLIRQAIDKAAEAERLHALIDGIALHSLLHPEEFPAEKMIERLKYHLDSICN
ncbi:TetR/AcrR family transcriptional regulator [Virgibacillus doumboii]|uniref:TetR/AcrR family transcriptional regulator n=1 Tax=Virgibacillus doumboii TaxID=2697503 RepID=UPI0013DEF11C|nr:TetR family transcriptional regulator C-terminal domain-containing protein [Virgibacillus doumboii]